MTRAGYVAFALIAYCVFFATFLYLIAFVGDLPLVAKTVDRGPGGAVATALVVDVLLIGLFGLQHSAMARQGFKRAWTRVVPEPIERSLYVLATSVVLIVLFACWRPIAGTVWAVENALGAALLWALFSAGWGIVLLSTFLINHFELFGLSQVIRHWRAARPADPQFRQPLFYRIVRHPLYSGFFLAFWATPVMSAGHLLLAAGLSVYILIAIRLEERDLVALFGERYQTYRQSVGMLTPRFSRARRR